MFPQMLMTAFTPLCDTNELQGWENKPFTTSWPEPQENYVSSSQDYTCAYQDVNIYSHQSSQLPTESDYSFSGYPHHGMAILRFPQGKSEGNQVTKTIKKKKKRNRTAFSSDQLSYLEQCFKHNEYIDVLTRHNIAKSTQLTERTIKIWFQNRRMKKKKEALDVCDSDSSGTSTPVVESTQDVTADSPTDNVPSPVPQHNPQHVSQYVAQHEAQQWNPIANAQQHDIGNYDYSQVYNCINYPNNIDVDFNMRSLQNNAFSEIHYDYQPEYENTDFVTNKQTENESKYNNDQYNYLRYNDFM